MQESRLWLLNHVGNAFTISVDQTQFSQLKNTFNEVVTVKRLSASRSCAWAIGHDHRVYIYMFSSDVPIRVPDTTYENQRWTPLHGFSCKGLIPTDRNAWSHADGSGDRPKESVRLPSAHWQWEGNWFIDDNLRGEVVGIEGWQYAVDFPSMYSPEKHWNSFVRKRKWIRFRRFISCDTWARVSDMEVVDKAECFIDISVGGFLMPTHLPGALSVWGVTNNGNVYVRTSVHNNNPEGSNWHEIDLDRQLGVINISVGVSNLVWAVTWDGNALVRTNVTRNNVYGTEWTLVQYPNENIRLMQVAVGHNAVWALSRDGKVWFRKGTWGDDVYGNVQSSIGTKWVEMVGEMMHIAVSADDQVFAIDRNTKDIVFRTSVTRTDLTGKTWQVITLKEDLSLLEKEGRLSAGIVCSCCDENDVICEYHRNFLLDSRSSSSSLTQMNIDDSSSDVFIQTTESSHIYQHSSDNDTLKEKEIEIKSHIPERQVIPLISHDDSIANPSETSLIQTHKLTNSQSITASKVSSHIISQTVADEKIHEALSRATVKSLSLVQSTVTEVLNQNMQDPDKCSQENDNSEKKEAKAFLNLAEDISIHKERNTSSHKMKKHRKPVSLGNEDVISSSIVFDVKKEKKKQRHDQSESHIDNTYDSTDSPSRVKEICTTSNDIDVNPQYCYNRAENQLSDDLTRLNEKLSSTNLASEKSSDTALHFDGKDDSYNEIKDGLMDAVTFVLSREPSFVQEKKETTESVKDSISVQISIQDPPVSSDSSSIIIQKEPATKRSQFMSAPSWSIDSSSASDEIIDFVTDLMSDEDGEQDLSATKNSKEEQSVIDLVDNTKISQVRMTSFSSQAAGLQSSTRNTVNEVVKGSLHSQSPSVISRKSEEDDNMSDQPEEDISRHSSFASTKYHQPSSTSHDDSCSDTNSAVIQLYTLGVAQPRLSWKWLDVTSCLIGNPSTVSWLITSSQGSKRQTKPSKISLTLRNDILGKLKERNRREILPYTNIEQAVKKKTWVKCTKMHAYLYGNRNYWVLCNVELEQGISNLKKGCLTLQYTHKHSQKQIQISLSDITCIKLSPNLDNRSTFLIYSLMAEVLNEPLMLRAASETEASEWMGYLCMANASTWKVDRGISPGVAWSCTASGDVFVGVDLDNKDLCWGQHGGHMYAIETGPSGVTWALGFDQTAYVYNGGYGGVFNVDMTGMSDNLQEITDHDRVYVYENQKWFPVVGWCSKGVFQNDFHWMTPSGKCVASRDDIKLPSSKWQWMSDWTADFESPGGVDSNGWQFSKNLSGHYHPSQRMRDCYRRRRWTRTNRLNTHGPWQATGSLKLMDISIQVDPVSSSTDPIILWAVGANGNVLCRSGVTMSNPEGESWIHVATFLDKPCCSISVGGGYRVWGIASDGSAWYRSEVSQSNHSGKCWLQVVPPPPGNSWLKQVSAGATGVWAVDRRDCLWRRENITPTFPEGTGWDFVASKVKRVSVGPDDQVWIVADSGFSKSRHGSGVIYKRIGFSEKRPSGTDWKAVIGAGWSHVSVRGMNTSSDNNNLDTVS